MEEATHPRRADNAKLVRHGVRADQVEPCVHGVRSMAVVDGRTPSTPRRADNAKLVRQGAAPIKSNHASTASDPWRWWMEERHPPHVGRTTRSLSAMSPRRSSRTMRPRVRSMAAVEGRAPSAPRRADNAKLVRQGSAPIKSNHASTVSDLRRWWMERRHPPYVGGWRDAVRPRPTSARGSPAAAPRWGPCRGSRDTAGTAPRCCHARGSWRGTCRRSRGSGRRAP